MTDLIRASSLANFADLVHELGGDPEALLRARGVDPRFAGQHDRFVTYTAVCAVFTDAARTLNCPDFGLRLSRRQRIDILGPVAVIARHSDTVGTALDEVSRYLHSYSPTLATALVRGPESSEFTFTVLLRHLVHRQQAVEVALGIGIDLMRFLVAPDFVPIAVHLEHSPGADPHVYRELFGVDVAFDEPRNGIVLPNRVLDTPIRDRDAAAHELAERYLAAERVDLTTPDLVRGLIERLLPLGQATLIGVARELTLHPRVLQRRLADTGDRFESLLDDVRREQALRLAPSGLSAAEIATALGYAEASSFTRACRRWFGVPPRRLLAEAR
ncbi:AraC family transcriptional regulator [Gordonia phosphorivorans]|uniref:AraC family transcriptional regulator n=1 Tax=Gordonia phosphorivorans TaxID=1056982 RepID=A0ABV6HC51_9ACTN